MDQVGPLEVHQISWIMKQIFKVEPSQIDGSGSSQIPRLCAAPAPKPCLFVCSLTVVCHLVYFFVFSLYHRPTTVSTGNHILQDPERFPPIAAEPFTFNAVPDLKGLELSLAPSAEKVAILYGKKNFVSETQIYSKKSCLLDLFNYRFFFTDRVTSLFLKTTVLTVIWFWRMKPLQCDALSSGFQKIPVP